MIMASTQRQFKVNDEYYTPECAVIPLVKFLKPHSTIWCPFDTESSMFVRTFVRNDFTVLHSHVNDLCGGGDFFTHEVPDCDYIISNPPYSRKDDIVKHLYEIGKPFAMLLNAQGICDSKSRFKLFRKFGTEILWLYPRVKYTTIDRPIFSPPFQSAYLCYKILPDKMQFEYLSGEEESIYG